MNSYELYDLKVTTLTPLHIGSGRELLNGYDYAIHNGRTWRLNDSAILDSQVLDDDPKTVDRLAKLPPAQLLNNTDFDPDIPFFRYVLDGEPRSEIEGSQLREQLKNVNDEPYLPGSSLKGSLRTSIAWYGWGEKKLMASPNDIYHTNRKGEQEALPPKFVGQVFERKLLGRDPDRRGKDPNYDILRALQVSDSKAVAKESMMILNTQVIMHGGNLAVPVEVEAISPETEFSLTIKVDSSLFSDWARRHGLDLPNTGWVGDFSRAANEHAKTRIDTELNWFEGINGTKRITNFYNQIRSANLSDEKFLLQVGWGTGWDNMTFDSRLRENPKLFAAILEEYDLKSSKSKLGDPFPASRHLAVRVAEGRDGQEMVSLTHPMGWVLVEMTKRKRG